MNILLTGASGFIGHAISRALIAAGHQVKPVSRQTGYNFNDMLQPSDWIGLLHNIDIVINSVGIINETRASCPGQTFKTLHKLAPIALFQACIQSQVKRIIQISALGADANAFTPYQLSKKAADDFLREQLPDQQQTPPDWFILRPSLVIGREGASTRFFRQLARLPFIIQVNDGNQKVQPVYLNDLVDAVLLCMTSPQAKQTIDVVGPETFSFSDWLQLNRKLLGKKPAPVMLIKSSTLLKLAKPLGLLFPLISVDNIRMLQQGNISNPQALGQLLGHPPAHPSKGLS